MDKVEKNTLNQKLKKIKKKLEDIEGDTTHEAFKIAKKKLKKIRARVIRAEDSNLTALFTELVKQITRLESGPVENRVSRVHSDLSIDEAHQMLADSLTFEQIKLQEEFIENTARVRNIRE